jgi:tRNA (adenine57-N1/adenine58-N1)-methyltransferase
MFIIYHCDIKSGDFVVEAGSGSGALTILLANFVRPKGKVISYEMRNEFLKIAEKNVKNSQLSDYVKFKKGDVTEKISEKNADSVILDLPNPQDVLENAFFTLKLGGHLATYLPTINQVEKAVRKMRDLDFAEIKTIETLQREIVVGEGGVRPSFDMLGHTGYVTFCRKVNE